MVPIAYGTCTFWLNDVDVTLHSRPFDETFCCRLVLPAVPIHAGVALGRLTLTNYCDANKRRCMINGSAMLYVQLEMMVQSWPKQNVLINSAV
jgi:hypothetical protein